MEILYEYAKTTVERVKDRYNVTVINESSHKFLKSFVGFYQKWNRNDNVLVYLDAHFYNPGAKTQEERWVILHELRALEGFDRCILVIHDVSGCGEGLHGLVYDGEPLTFDLLKDSLLRVNPKFHFYINAREFIEVHTPESIVGVKGLEPDEDTLETINFHSGSDRRKYRGALYCVPEPLDLTEYQLLPLMVDI